MRAAGVNPVETYIRAGTYAKLPALPYTPGGEGTGDVEAVGEGVTKFKAGDRVYLAGAKTGTYAEYCLALDSTVFPLPPNTSYEAGASLGVAYATAHRALFRAVHARAGETCLVHGASGGVGLAAVQLAKACGCTVIGTASSEVGRGNVKAAGADHVIAHADSVAAFAEQVMALTHGKGADVVIEMLASANLQHDLAALARGGRVAVVGSRGAVEINPRDLMSREAAIVGVSNAFQVGTEEAIVVHAQLFDWLSEGTLKPLEAHAFPLHDAAAAHVEVMEHSGGTKGKIVLHI
uniref:Enoyl reductase (ER) domain-containing protein n=1 Tax=Cryptomonas curvata TaxID=233186 RepID=A0A7S0MSH7_9CRYP